MAKRRYVIYWDQPYFHFIQADVCDGLPNTDTFDYMIHGASMSILTWDTT